MSETLLANLFFIITGAAIIVVAVFLCVLIYQLLKTVRALRGVLERVEQGTEMIVGDMQFFREQILRGKFLVALFQGIAQAFAPEKKKRRSAKKKKDVTND